MVGVKKERLIIKYCGVKRHLWGNFATELKI